MASYFDEHNCEPLADGQRPNHMLHFARLLLDGGWGAQMELEFDQMFPRGHAAPPASKSALAELKRFKADKNSVGQQCPVCIGEFLEGLECIRMPCKHHFHANCIVPWLEKTNSCPVCRYELPTDDTDYEEFKKQKKREAEREENLKELHNSMFT